MPGRTGSEVWAIPEELIHKHDSLCISISLNLKHNFSYRDKGDQKDILALLGTKETGYAEKCVYYCTFGEINYVNILCCVFFNVLSFDQFK